MRLWCWKYESLYSIPNYVYYRNTSRVPDIFFDIQHLEIQNIISRALAREVIFWIERWWISKKISGTSFVFLLSHDHIIPPPYPSLLVLNLKNKSTTRIFIKPTKLKKNKWPLHPHPPKLSPWVTAYVASYVRCFSWRATLSIFFLIRRSLSKVERRIKCDFDEGNVLFLLDKITNVKSIYSQ